MTIGPALLTVVHPRPGEPGPLTLSIRWGPDEYRTPFASPSVTATYADCLAEALRLLALSGEAYADRMFRVMSPLPGDVEAMFPHPIPQFAYVEGERIREMQEKLAGLS